MADSVVIVSAARTPMGSFQGDFSTLSAHDLGGAAIKAAVERAGIPADAVGEVLFGNCLMAAPPRSCAERVEKSPWNDPMGVRAALTMTTESAMVHSCGVWCGFRCCWR